MRRRDWLTPILLLVLAGNVHAQAPYVFAVQPILSPESTRRAFEPLAEYLSQSTGERIRLETAVNFVAYWETMKQGRYDLVLDAAHFTDFRIKRLGYRVLAKIPDTVSLTLVTASNVLIFEPAELVGRRLATLGPPSMPAVRATQLFPNPIRLPVIVDFENSNLAIEAVQQGKVVSAIIPSPLVRNYPELNTVLTTEPIPHIALSVGPRVPPPAAERIRSALLSMEGTPAGERVLQFIRLPPFVATTDATYDGYAHLLDGVWGY